MKSWEIKSLGDICEFGNGLWTGKKPPFQKVGVIRNTNFTKDGKLDDSDIVYLDVEQSQYTKRKLQYGDIILEKSGGGPKQPVGRVIIFDKKKGDFSFSNFTSLIRITNPKTVDFTYLHKFLFFYYISGATETMQTHSTGIRNLKFDDYKDISIPLPPLQEQERIVAILDEAFAAIAKAKANAEQNFKNAKELFESYLQGVFENKGEGWEEKEFGDIITTLTDYHANGSYKILKKNVELKDTEDYSWMVRSTDFENDFQNDFRYIDEKGYNFLSKSKVFGGEIIMSKIGNAGNVYLMLKVNIPYTLTMNLFLIRLNEKKAIPEYIFQYLKSKKGEIQIKSRLLGMATKTITKDNVRNIIIPFPPLKEQKIIIKKLEALSSETKKLESIYNQKINNLEELKKSILQKAFAGELNTKINVD
ncbi:MAG: restriction endonuclease subunit S [Saprospiraceae bacterium]|nr:restriction endonuclease subunit S [Candidatus Defluviibacterium haderslevense]